MICQNNLNSDTEECGEIEEKILSDEDPPTTNEELGILGY